MLSTPMARYFDTIAYGDLLRPEARRVSDKRVLRDSNGIRRMIGGKSNEQDTPQGGVISADGLTSSVGRISRAAPRLARPGRRHPLPRALRATLQLADYVVGMGYGGQSIPRAAGS